MRQQAMENLLIMFEDVVDNMNKVEFKYEKEIKYLKNLSAKSKILRDRSDRSASVVRELING